MTEQVRVGVGLFLLKQGKFLIGVRKRSIGAGTIALPGGHLDFGESFEHCASRELEEETGLVIDEKTVKFLTATNTHFETEGKQYVTIFMLCDVGDGKELGEPEVKEPEKCEGWQWVSWDELLALPRKSLFQPIQNLITTRQDVRL